MRVFFLSYAHERGIRADAGGFRKLWEVARALARCGVEVQVLYPDLPGHAPLTDVPCRAYPVLDLPFLRPVTAYASMLASAIRLGLGNRPDAVYFRSGINVLPLALKTVFGAKAVLEVNADVSEFFRVEGIGGLRPWCAGLAERTNARRSDLIVTLTPGLKRMLVGRYDVPEAKVTVVPSGTDTEHFVPMDQAGARRRLGLPEKGPVVGFVGLLYRHQGVATLLEAIAALRHTVPGLLGLIVGDGVMRAEWESLARRLGVADLVRFTGQVSYRDVPALLNAMDVVVTPFTADRGETSPFKLFDAMACGRPVVSSDIPSVRAYADDSKAVVLVPPDDPGELAQALQRLLADPARRADLGRLGRDYVAAHHSWDHIGRRLTSMLETVA